MLDAVVLRGPHVLLVVVVQLHKIKSAPPRLDSSGPSEGGSSGPPPVASGSGRGGGEGSDRMAVDGEGRRPTEDGGAWMRGSRGPAAAPAAGSGRSSPPAYEAPSWSRNSHIYDVVAQVRRTTRLAGNSSGGCGNGDSSARL